MKTNKNKLIKIIFAWILVALLFNAICTWGIIFDCEGGFEQSSASLFKDTFTDDVGFAWMTLGGDGSGENLNNPIVIIPLVFSIYGIEPPPYDIHFTIRDDTARFTKIIIESVSIEYVDGQTKEHKIKWKGEFKRRKTPFDNMENWNPSDFPNPYMKGKLPVTVDRLQSCKIRFVGYFVNKDNSKIPFDATGHFEYKPYKWNIYPFMYSL